MDTDSFIGFVIILILSAISIVPFFRIFQRTGRSGWWALLMLIPIVNIAVLYVLAFALWPAFDRL